MDISIESGTGDPSSNCSLVCNIHFFINVFGKGMNPFLPITYALNNRVDLDDNQSKRRKTKSKSWKRQLETTSQSFPRIHSNSYSHDCPHLAGDGINKRKK